MPDEPIDGSNLEPGNPEPAVAVTEQVQTETAPPAETQQPQPPQQNIPEQYRGKTEAELIQELQKRDSTLGKYRAEVGTLRQVRETARYGQPNQVYNQQIPSSLPGYEVPGQRSGQIDIKKLNENFYESPIEAIIAAVDPVVEKRVAQGIQSYQQQTVAQQQVAAASRAQWISDVDNDELQNLRLEENFTADHEALMESLAKRDPEVISMIRNPNISEQGIREAVRKLYAKADGILNGQLQDPEKIKALNIAQKDAAAKGAPNPRASTSGATDKRTADVTERWGFLLGG